MGGKEKESDIREEPFILKVFSYVHECGHMYEKENFIIFILTRLFSGFIRVMQARCLRHLKNRKECKCRFVCNRKREMVEPRDTASVLPIAALHVEGKAGELDDVGFPKAWPEG